MFLELIIISIILFLYLSSNNLLNLDIITNSNLPNNIIKNYKVAIVATLFILILLVPGLFKNLLSSLFNIKEKNITNNDLLDELNFVNNVRSITEYYKNHTKNLEDEKKRFILSKQNYKCSSCPSILNEDNSILDLILSLNKGGTTDMSNIQVLCRNCYNKKNMFDKLL